MPESKKYLNRDGLEEYNSLLPHSSGEMQEYVNDWLDEHPEATTTVQYGAISEPKLADNSVSLRTLADDTVHMLKGMMITQEISGEILTANDAYSAPPVTLTVEGKSTQDGTPTPESPVEIVSLEQVLLGFAPNLWQNLVAGFLTTTGTISTDASYGTTGFFPVQTNDVLYIDCLITQSTRWVAISLYDGNKNHLGRYTRGVTNFEYRITNQSAAYARVSAWDADGRDTFIVTKNERPSTLRIPFTQALRSLSAVTHDELSFSYLRPSTREGWAWYGATLTQNVGHVADMGALTWSDSVSANGIFYATIDSNNRNGFCLCSCYQSQLSTGSSALRDGYVCKQSGFARVLVKDTAHAGLTSAEYAALLSGQIFDYMLATPVTTTLDPIELPVLPAPNCTVWSDPSTGLKMQYVRDSNIVIQRIEEAIADQ